MAALRSKVAFELTLNTEELPPPFGTSDEDAEGGLGGSADDLGDDDGFDDDDDDDFDEDDFDEDDDDDNLEEDGDDRY